MVNASFSFFHTFPWSHRYCCGCCCYCLNLPFCIVHTREWGRDNMLHYVLYLLLNVDERVLLSVAVAFSLFPYVPCQRLKGLHTAYFHIHVLIPVCLTEVKEHASIRTQRRREKDWETHIVFIRLSTMK